MHNLLVVNIHTCNKNQIIILSLSISWNSISGLERWWDNSWEEHLFNLPLKYLKVFVFPSARPFSENAGSSEVNDQNNEYLFLGHQQFCCKTMSSQARTASESTGGYVPPTILHKIFLELDCYLTYFLTLHIQIYNIFPMKGYTALSMRHQTYPIQNQNDIQCWCSIRGKSASESSDKGDPGTYK